MQWATHSLTSIIIAIMLAWQLSPCELVGGKVHPVYVPGEAEDAALLPVLLDVVVEPGGHQGLFLPPPLPLLDLPLQRHLAGGGQL